MIKPYVFLKSGFRQIILFSKIQNCPGPKETSGKSDTPNHDVVVISW